VPTPNFCSWQAVREQVASNLHVTPDQLPAEWDNICSHSARRAAADLRSILILKGYTPDQVAGWDDAYTYSLQLATWMALGAGSALASYDAKLIEWMDCRKELREAAALIIGGAVVGPTPTEVGGVGHGVADAVGEARARFDTF
jgi:hypothetical protein